MKGLLSAAFLIIVLSARVAAQDATMLPQSYGTNSQTMAKQSDASVDRMPNQSSAPDSGSSAPASAHKTYSGGYGGRADVFVTGFGLFSNHANDNAVAEQQTNAGGFAAGYRFHLSQSSALEGRYGFSRNSDQYTIGGAVSSIPSYFSEISGSYVYNFPQLRHIQPFLEGGGGLALFIPGNYGAPASATTGGTTTGTSSGLPFGYALPTVGARDIAAPLYSGSSPGIGTQARGMFLYGGGVDIPAFSHFYIRTEFRGLGYEVPDFKLSALHTNALGSTYESSFGLAYRF
jgi:hypothetical protein